MAYSFEWNGVSSATYGLYVEKITPPIRPATRQTREAIPGRDGYVTTGDSSLGECMRYAECYLPDLTQRDMILWWLRGTGVVVFSTEPDRYCNAAILDQLEFVEAGPGNTLIVAFACQPYRYVFPEPSALTLTASPGTITNPGTADAEPIITVVGSGNITLTIGDKTMTITALASQITFDAETGFALDGSGGDLTSGVALSEWPMSIPPGISAVSWTGTVTSVTITRPWRYI